MNDDLDILKEVGNIAAGHGSIALSEILGRKLRLHVPVTDVVIGQQIPTFINIDRIVVAVYSKILVGLQGEAAFIMDEKNAYKLIDMSCRIKKDEKAAGLLTEVGVSFLKEIGNVVIGAYINALSLMLRRCILPPLPTLISGSIEDILNILFAPYASDDYSYLVEAVFEEDDEKIKGSFYLILTPDAARDIRDTCKKLLNDISNG